jgi:hypothetical protein
MNKIIISLIALGAISTGAFAEPNNVDTEGRMFIARTLGHADVAPVGETKALAVADEASGYTAFQKLIIRTGERQNGDDNN